MNKQRSITIGCVAFVALMVGMTQLTLVRGAEAPVLTAQGEKIAADYTQMLEELKKEIAPVVPAVDEKKKAAFTAAHKAVSQVPGIPVPKGIDFRKMPPRHSPLNPPYKVAQSNAVIAATPLVVDMDAFLSSDKLDVKLRKCALLSHATPRGLAEFAQQGQEEAALIDELLGDDKLIKQAMELGGAYKGKYGKAMQSYKAIQKASKRAETGFWQRFALASSMEHPYGCVGVSNQGVSRRESELTDAEVNVEVFLDYEKAYLEGKLDEAFGTYSDFNWRFVMHIYPVKDLNWMRDVLRNYRPDHIRNPDYKWRYCRITRTDVPYADPDRSGMPADLSRFQKFFLEGGICGPRCFVGKLACSSFGIPCRFATQNGHAAMCHWTPDGWTTVFGRQWMFNRHRRINGQVFSLEERARNEAEAYMKVLRAEWVGDALGEAKVREDEYGVGGGLWNALAFYKKLAIVEESEREELAPTGEELAESNVEATPEEIVMMSMTEADKTIVVGRDGVITIPPAACLKPTNCTARIRFMRTIEDDAIQVHYSLGDGRPELLKYRVEAPAAGTYELSMQVCTLTMDRKFMLRLNRRTLLDIPLPYTKGYWKDTEPLSVELKKGRNTLLFTTEAPNKGVSIKYFNLKPVTDSTAQASGPARR